MDPNASSAVAAPPADTAAAPSFADQWAAASQQPATDQGTGQSAPPAQEAAKVETAAVQAPDPNAAPEWLKQFGEYKTPDELKSVLGKLPTLEQNQLTDEHKANLRLLTEPAMRKEYLQLLDADYTAMDDEAMLLQDFKDRHPTLTAEDAELVFQQQQDDRYPGLANEEGDPTRRAHAAMRKAAADEVRAKYTTQRDTKLAEFQKGALPPVGESPEKQQQVRDAHFDKVKTLVGKGADAFKLTVDVDGKPLNLAVEAADLPAIQALMESPLAPFANEDGTTNYDAVKEYAVLKTMFPKFLGLAQKAALEQQGPVVALGELHNGEGGGTAAQRPTDTLSFSEQLAKNNGGAKPRQNY